MMQFGSSPTRFLLRALLVAMVLSLAATSALAYWPTPAPTPPAKGAKIADPSYGNLIMRVTDSSDGGNMGTSYSYWPTFSKNNGHIAFYNLDSGFSYVQDFDPVNFLLVGSKRAMFATNPPGGGAPEWDDPIWSGLDDNSIFCHEGTKIWSYNVNTQAWTLTKDLAGRFLAGTAYFRQFSKSANDDVFAFSLQNASYGYIGYGVYKKSTDQVLVNVANTSFDEVQIDKAGRYLASKMNDGTVIVYDTQLGTNTTLTDAAPDFAPGHSDNGTNTCVGHDNYNNQLTFRNLGTPHSYGVVYNWGSNWAHGEHISFLLDDEAWVAISTYESSAPPNNTLRCEVFLIRTNGTGEVRHVCHHYSNYVSYYDSPRANISRDGKYIAFTSNWGASGRLDLWLVAVPPYGGGGPPVANFTGNPTSGTAPLTVAFTDSSTNTPTSWSWNFGDSSTSTAQSPSHVYAAGTYTVSLRATNAAGYDDEVKTNYITASTPPSPPVANFTGTPTSGTAPLAVAFTDTSTGSPTSWSWNFGDSTTSTAQSPSHTYSNGGSYTVTLTATNSGGSDGETKTNYITVSAGSGTPTFVAAGAVASNAAAITPALPAGIVTNDILLLFLETANQALTIANQNGGTWTEVTNSPQGTGTAGGTAATRLTVFWSRYNGTQGAPTTSDSGNHQAGRIVAARGCITSGNPWDVTAGGVEATVDTSGSIPGATTTVANTLVVAAISTALPDAAGTANFSAWANANLGSVTERTDNTVTAGNGGGLAVATGEKATAGAYGNTTVTAATATAKGLLSLALKPSGGGGSPPVAAFSGTPTSGTAPLAVSFTDSSTNTPTSWSWNFGDSTTSTAQNPSHTYAAGTYTVSLRATNASGYDDEVKTNYITASGASYVYVYPDTWTVNSYTPGVTLQSGGLPDLQSDNAVYMVVRCDTSTQRCGVMYTVDTPYTPSQVNNITWEYQAKVSRSDTPSALGNLFVRKSDGSWEARANWVPGTTDTTWTWNSTAVATYMSSTGVLGFELCTCPTTGNTNNYDISTDLLRFRLDLN